MKTIQNYLMLFALLTFVASCNNAPKGEKAATGDAAVVKEVAAAKSMSVNTTTSVITWEGSKVGGSHAGTLKLSDGKLNIKDGKVAGGTFTIDMASMANTDLPAEKQGDLVGHLASGDFFDVAKFPTAKFAITKVTGLTGDAAANAMVYGNLTMKDVTKEVGFKANINVGANGVTVSTPNFTIDRTDFGIKYGSTKLADVVKDKAINDNIGLSINLSAS